MWKRKGFSWERTEGGTHPNACRVAKELGLHHSAFPTLALSAHTLLCVFVFYSLPDKWQTGIEKKFQ